MTVIAAVIAGCSGSSSGAQSGSGSTAPAQATPAPTESNPPGDIPDNQVYVDYQPAHGFSGFTVKVPEGWARTDKGGTTVFTDKLNSVTITAATASTSPTVASVKNTVVPQLSGQVTKFASPKVSQVTRKAGPVVLLAYQGDSAKDPVTGKVVRDAFERYVFYRQGHKVDLTLSGPVNADNVDPWRTVSDSFAWR
ncbi:lipoprotein [Streptomyces phaeofaciens JCM 4814]|uniref:Lipoprotein n=1 Tax=Streptomyces phaeofaciens TaxID=68254 RepID=A0A918HC12_9ACTN|nr:lipoprotein [Streptomyces phaeofaciens]